NPIPISNGGMSYGDEPMIELYAVTQEQYDAVLALIDSTTSFVDYDQNVGMVFQRPNPFPKSIFENVAYGLRVNGITDNAFIRQRVEETLK
ncbi:hypothetical protein OSK93_23960, partial [Escherichia coli]|nr:hypothetical protein [Escherichia coli]